MTNNLKDLIARIVESGFKSTTMEDQDIIIHWLKNSLAVEENQWKEEKLRLVKLINQRQ
jgi:hypothetical protein